MAEQEQHDRRTKIEKFPEKVAGGARKAVDLVAKGTDKLSDGAQKLTDATPAQKIVDATAQLRDAVIETPAELARDTIPNAITGHDPMDLKHAIKNKVPSVVPIIGGKLTEKTTKHGLNGHNARLDDGEMESQMTTILANEGAHVLKRLKNIIQDGHLGKLIDRCKSAIGLLEDEIKELEERKATPKEEIDKKAGAVKDYINDRSEYITKDEARLTALADKVHSRFDKRIEKLMEKHTNDLERVRGLEAEKAEIDELVDAVLNRDEDPEAADAAEATLSDRYGDVDKAQDRAEKLKEALEIDGADESERTETIGKFYKEEHQFLIEERNRICGEIQDKIDGYEAETKVLSKEYDKAEKDIKSCKKVIDQGVDKKIKKINGKIRKLQKHKKKLQKEEDKQGDSKILLGKRDRTNLKTQRQAIAAIQGEARVREEMKTAKGLIADAKSRLKDEDLSPEERSKLNTSLEEMEAERQELKDSLESFKGDGALAMLGHLMQTSEESRFGDEGLEGISQIEVNESIKRVHGLKDRHKDPDFPDSEENIPYMQKANDNRHEHMRSFSRDLEFGLRLRNGKVASMRLKIADLLASPIMLEGLADFTHAAFKMDDNGEPLLDANGQLQQKENLSDKQIHMMMSELFEFAGKVDLLDHAQVQNVKLTGVNLDSVSMESIKFVGCKFRGNNLTNIHAPNMHLIDCKLYSGELKGDMRGIIFDNTPLYGVDLLGSDLRGHSFENHGKPGTPMFHRGRNPFLRSDLANVFRDLEFVTPSTWLNFLAHAPEDFFSFFMPGGYYCDLRYCKLGGDDSEIAQFLKRNASEKREHLNRKAFSGVMYNDEWDLSREVTALLDTDSLEVRAGRGDWIRFHNRRIHKAMNISTLTTKDGKMQLELIAPTYGFSIVKQAVSKHESIYAIANDRNEIIFGPRLAEDHEINQIRAFVAHADRMFRRIAKSGQLEGAEWGGRMAFSNSVHSEIQKFGAKKGHRKPSMYLRLYKEDGKENPAIEGTEGEQQEQPVAA